MGYYRSGKKEEQMNRILVTFIFLWISIGHGLFGQGFTDSNLPIIIITTDGGAPIVDDPRVPATMKVIYRGEGERNRVDDQYIPGYLDYNGKIDIEIRGSSTQSMPKKQYGFTTLMPDNKTKNNVSLLGLPNENDWILNAMVFDPALMRDFLCYNLSRQIGEYASRTVYCELVINGSYKGIYLLQEKIKVDENRVNITRIKSQDNSIPELTGGYIIKADKTTGGDPVAWTMKDWYGRDVVFIHSFPKPRDITKAQSEYIHDRFLSLEAAANSGNTSSGTGFQYLIDIPSFVNYMLISELSSNSDAYQFSTFFHKDRNGKLRAGPVWDNDLTFGNDLFFWGYDRSKPNIWQFSNGDNEGPRFWRNLFNNNEFKCALSRRWNSLVQPDQPFNIGKLESFIDMTAAYISEAVSRDNALWRNTGNHQQRIQEIKTFLDARIRWITDNLPSFADCGDVIVPPLVISGIMYHPAPSSRFPENDDMEFIEITNNGDLDVDPEGIFFAGTGLVYEFPPGFMIKARSSVYLAGNIKAFRAIHGFSPSGQFSRNLSNKGEDLILCDPFGNVVDFVTYGSSPPWPDANGNGYYLKLVNPDLDNNEPGNWVASNDILTSSEHIPTDLFMTIYPNPARDFLSIRADKMIKQVVIQDIYGKKLLHAEPWSMEYIMDIHVLTAGFYIISVETDEGKTSRKFIKALD